MKNEGSHELDVTFSEVIEYKKIMMGVGTTTSMFMSLTVKACCT